jgi:hypothetical protein
MFMKISLKEIKLAEAPLTKFIEQTIPIKLAYRLGKLIRLMQQELQQIEASRIKLVKQYGTENEGSSTIEVKPESMQQFNEEWLELLDTQADIDFEPIDAAVLDELNISMTPIEMTFLSKFFKE